MPYIAFFILGGLWGSFSNVCIYRIPNNKSVIINRSYCPKCKNKIGWFDNIPFLSFVLLKGKCRNCNKAIGLQYFIVELLSAVSFVIIYHFYGISITSLLLLILSIYFIIIFFIDLKHLIIPNSLTFSLMFLGFIKSFDPNLDKTIFPNYINSLIGGIFGYSIIWLIVFVYKKIRKKEGMGLGDAKLLGAIGFWFGWASIPFTIFLSSVAALIFVIPSIINKSRNMASQIPFGPYIIIGCIIYLIFLNEIKNILF